jgi:hypothetical protein
MGRNQCGSDCFRTNSKFLKDSGSWSDFWFQPELMRMKERMEGKREKGGPRLTLCRVGANVPGISECRFKAGAPFP